jgi:hypothetical protein
MSPIARTLTPPGVAIDAHRPLQRPVSAPIPPQRLR